MTDVLSQSHVAYPKTARNYGNTACHKRFFEGNQEQESRLHRDMEKEVISELEMSVVSCQPNLPITTIGKDQIRGKGLRFTFSKRVRSDAGTDNSKKHLKSIHKSQLINNALYMLPVKSVGRTFTLTTDGRGFIVPRSGGRNLCTCLNHNRGFRSVLS